MLEEGLAFSCERPVAGDVHCIDRLPDVVKLIAREGGTVKRDVRHIGFVCQRLEDLGGITRAFSSAPEDDPQHDETDPKYLYHRYGLPEEQTAQEKHEHK